MGMTKQMLEDYVKQVKRTLRIQRIVIFTLALLLVLMFAFAMSSFEIVVNEDTDIDYDVEQETSKGGNNTNTVILTTDNQTYIICGTVMVCVAIITTGVVAYGKSKNTYLDTKTSSSNDTQKLDI